jgi:hypothetical protein
MTQSESDNKNRGGRPIGIRGVRTLASRHALDCVRVLVDVANSEQALEADRVRAAEVILGYATSRPETKRGSGDSHGT